MPESSDASEEIARYKKLLRAKNRRIKRLESRLATAENVIRLGMHNQSVHWLYQHRSERMDATVEIYNSLRRQFHLARYDFAAKHVDGLCVADIACGTGYGSEILANANAEKVIGVDICDETIQYAREKHGSDNIDYICAAGSETGMEAESLDVVVSFETIEHVEDDASLIDEFNRVLRPGGLLICSTPNDWPLEVAPHHVRQYNRDTFSELLSRKFVEIELFNQNSGSDSWFNHKQTAGIVATTDDNFETAECFLSICRKTS